MSLGIKDMTWEMGEKLSAILIFENKVLSFERGKIYLTGKE